MRRAISCVYCAPKSRIRILSEWMSVMTALAWLVLRFGRHSRESGNPVTLLVTMGQRQKALDSCFRRNDGNKAAPASAGAVIRRFLGDLHVVHMAFAHASGGDLHERGLLPHVLDG